MIPRANTSRGVEFCTYIVRTLQTISMRNSETTLYSLFRCGTAGLYTSTIEQSTQSYKETCHYQYLFWLLLNMPRLYVARDQGVWDFTFHTVLATCF